MTTLQEIQYDAMRFFFSKKYRLVDIGGNDYHHCLKTLILVHGISKYSKLASMVVTATKGYYSTI